MSLNVGGGYLHYESAPWATLSLSLADKYFLAEQNTAFISDFGFANFLDLYGKIDWVVSPVVGLGSCWGYSYDELLFFETDGIYIGIGALVDYERFSLELTIKQYIPFFKELQFSPLIQLIGRFKIGEWWE
jgi:hypothetical protein